MSIENGVMAHNIIYSVINLLLLVTIIMATYRSIIEYRKEMKAGQQANISNAMTVILFILGFIFNMVSIFCIFALFFKSLSQLTSIPNSTASNPLFFACNLVFLQNIFYLLALFVRIFYVFNEAPKLALSKRTIVLFIIAFIMATFTYIILLTTKIRIPGVDTWVNCAVTLCIFNVFFMIVATSIFISKIVIVIKGTLGPNHQNSTARNGGLIHIITKTSLLSVISMIITFLSCLVLLFRFSLFVFNIYISILSEWIISANIYFNFL